MNLAGVDQYVKPLPPQGVERYVKPLHDYSRTQVKLAGDDAEDARPLPENDSPIKPRRSRQGQSIESANVPEAARRMKMSEEGFKRWWANEGGTLTINADDAPREMPLEHQSGPQETPPMPETRATVDAQIKAMREGRRKAVLVTPGTEMPPVPRGYTSTATAQGIFIHHPRRVSRDLVTQLANEDRHGELLGHVEPKSEATTAVVRASDPATGTEQQTSYVSPARVPAQVDELRRQFPASDIEAGGAETDARLLSDRAAQLSAEQQQQTPTTPAPLKVDSKYVRPLEPAAPSSLIPHSSLIPRRM
jgi:hypothetical protein